MGIVIPERILQFFTGWIGFRAESITGRGEKIFLWWRNVSNTPKEILTRQAEILKEMGIEIRLGPGLDLPKSLSVEMPCTKKDFLGVYVEQDHRFMFGSPVGSRQGQPFTDPFTPQP
jgi:hypothetical protein